MLIRRAETTEGRPMAMDGVQGVTMRMMVGREDGAPSFSLRHFSVEPGGHTPRHSHNYEHENYILAGRGRIEYDGEFHEIGPGDVLFLEPNRTHQFVNIGDQRLEFLCLVPTTYDCGGEYAPTPGS
jgi:quercetin dioxygenase-like cupin family protein